MSLRWETAFFNTESVPMGSSEAGSNGSPFYRSSRSGANHRWHRFLTTFISKLDGAPYYASRDQGLRS